VTAATISADGQRLIVVCTDGRLLQWTIVLGQIESRGCSQWVVDTLSKIN
jgi:hypothetical protein